MQFLLLIPFFWSLYYVIRGRRDKAFLNVFLPCTIVIPYYYAFRIPHFPVLSAGMGALIPLGISLLIRPETPWRFKRMDLFLLIYMISYGVSEVLREDVPKDGMILFLQYFVEMVFTYVVGRQLIEPKLRVETIKRVVFLFLCLTPFALYEFKMGQNPWLNLGLNFFKLTDVGWVVQLRGGLARVSASFGDAILAGMIFMVALALNYYLVQIYKRDNKILGPWMSKLQKYRIPFFVLAGFVYITGSRMPLVCCVICFLFMQIPRFKNMRTGAAIILTAVVVIGTAGYLYLDSYTSVSGDKISDEAQASAVYRKDLLIDYAPILDAAGWLGLGALSHPTVPGLESIDNDYLLIQLSQGKLGVLLFYLLIFESVLTLGTNATRFRSRESLFLLFSLLGALIGIFASLTTVYMGEQVPQVLFLLLGWSQSLQDTTVLSRAGVQQISGQPEPKFRFKRVIA